MTKSNFEKALYDAIAPEYGRAMQDVVDEHEFSPEFEKKMKKLINRRNKPYYKLINTAGKRTACAAVIVLVASSVTIMNVEALRNAFSDFFVNIYEKFSTVQPVEDDTAPITLEEIYEITYNLDGFTVIYDELDEHRHSITYLNEDIIIDFSQWTKSKYDVNINTEDADISTININGHEAVYFLDNQNYHTLIWDNGEYVIHIMSNTNKNTLIKIAESVKKAE